jgi:hypothetical protein
MTLFRFLFLGIPLCVLLLVPRSVWAQTVTLDERNGFRIERAEGKERSTSQRPNWISRQDCLDGDEIRYQSQSHSSEELLEQTWIRLFPRVVGASGNDTLEVWVSQTADCSDDDIINGNAQSCSLVFSTRATDDTPDIYLNPRDIVEANTSLRGEDWPGDDPTAGNSTTCDKQVEKPITYYIHVRTGDEIQPNGAKITIGGVDTLAPEPPDNIDAEPGDEHIFFEWEIDTSNEAEDTYGFAFFCVPQGTATDSGGSGLGGAGGAGGAEGAGNADCTQGVLTAGEIPSEQALDYICGYDTGRTTRSGQADGVTNNQLYAVAVAVTDEARNKGRLSEIACVTPKEVTTFFESYKDAGGQGGGGFCSQSQSPRDAQLAFVLAGALTLLYRRRRSNSK